MIVEVVVLCFQLRIRVDIELDQFHLAPGDERHQRLTHVITKMTVSATEQRKAHGFTSSYRESGAGPPQAGRSLQSGPKYRATASASGGAAAAMPTPVAKLWDVTPSAREE